MLVFDTAGPVIGVAASDGSALRVRTERVARGAEGVLLGAAQALLAELGWTAASLDGVGVVDGPGAFTGLRVGMATAAGLALAIDRPLWTAGSLATRAARAARPGVPVLAMLDARKAKVYAELRRDGLVLREVADLSPEEALRDLPAGVVATGEGAWVYRAEVEAAGCVVAPEADDPAVDVLAAWTLAGLARGEGGRAVDVQPRYVRAPDARPPALTRL